ncbi:hypothetical protein E3N88_41803 [Mikania micrantha]|uniref:Cyanobacterial aminoacyl-tRNA synthetase CAAD domain-containing protein n=1 Tax=Mikania micrantha TaxID=192012 RepID=A0A5N6LJK5_9ASTR|nr:hypothetical protein E3N88_41803 [Mikania micrantha]
MAASSSSMAQAVFAPRSSTTPFHRPSFRLIFVFYLDQLLLCLQLPPSSRIQNRGNRLKKSSLHSRIKESYSLIWFHESELFVRLIKERTEIVLFSVDNIDFGERLVLAFQVIISRHVVFDETIFPFSTNTSNISKYDFLHSTDHHPSIWSQVTGQPAPSQPAPPTPTAPPSPTAPSTPSDPNSTPTSIPSPSQFPPAAWNALENKPMFVIYGGGAALGVWLSSTVIEAFNGVPVIPKFLELVGLGYTGWFIYRYLLFKSTRKELADDIEALKKKIIGSE